MLGPYQVWLTQEAEDDLNRLTNFLLDRAQDLEELNRVEASIQTLRKAIETQLASNPWSFRKAGRGDRSTRRELVVPAGSTGYVALFEIESATRVLVLAIRHQLEQDYH